MKPKYLLRSLLLAAIGVFSFSAWGQAPRCDKDCLQNAVLSDCANIREPLNELNAEISTFLKVQNLDELKRKISKLELANRRCVSLTKVCPKLNCKNETAFRGPNPNNDEINGEKIDIDEIKKAARDRLEFANKQVCEKMDDCSMQPSIAKSAGARANDATDGVNSTAATYGSEDGSGTNSGGSTSGSGSRSADASKAKKSSDSGFDMKSAMPLMQAAMQMIAAQQAAQQQQQASCGGPNPAPGCPPQHICFTNPSSLECKCGPYGPGGPECGRPQLAATERNMGSPIEKEMVPPPPGEMSTDEMKQIPDFERSKTSMTGKPGGGGGGSLGNNSASSATTPKKKPPSGGGGSKNLEGARGFMGASPYKTGGAGKPAGSAEADEKKKREDPRYDPNLQGAQLHYGRMLQAGMENARRRTAGTRQMVTSKEVRPASDNIFKAVNEAYQAKNGTFLR